MDRKENTALYFKILAVLSFLLPLVMYVLTLCPTTYTEDAGEYISASYLLGVPHPPGYPLYCLMGKLFTFIPYGNIAWRVNFMSAFWGAAAAFVLFLLINRITKKTSIAFTSSMLFCFSDIFWSQCVVAEVYSFNIFFLVLCFYILHVWNENKKDIYLYSLSLIYGLSLCNHHFMLLAGPFILIYIVWSDIGILKRPGLIFKCLGLFALGLLPYFYLPLAARANPLMDFGHPVMIKDMLDHIQRKIYSDVSAAGGYGLLEKGIFIKAFIVQLAEQFYIPFIIIGLIGAWQCVKKDIKFFTLTFGVFIFNGFLLIFMRQFPANFEKIMESSVYYFPCYVSFICYIGLGIRWIWDIVKKAAGNRTIAEIALNCLILFLVLMPIAFNYHKNDLSKNYYVYDFVKSSIDLTDKDAMIFTSTDLMSFNIIYFQGVENYRKDIKMYDFCGALSGFYLGKDIRINAASEPKNQEKRVTVFNKIIDENYGKRPIYFSYDFDLGERAKYTLVPYGIIYKVVMKNEKVYFKEDPLLKIHIRNLNDPPVYRDYRVREMLCFYWQALAAYYESIKDIKSASTCYDKIYELGISAVLNNMGLKFYNEDNLSDALKFYLRAQNIDPYPPELNFNLGRLYEVTGKKDFAIKNYEEFCKKWRGDPGLTEYAKAVIKAIKKNNYR